jgi:hypothetical protein
MLKFTVAPIVKLLVRNRTYPKSVLTPDSQVAPISPSKLPKYIGINCVSPDRDVWLTFGGLGCPIENVSNLSIRMRAKAIGRFERKTGMLSWQLNMDVVGFAVEPSFSAGCGLEAHDSDPSEAWTFSFQQLTIINHDTHC